ncbi:MAG: hypothetical protein KAZ98_02835 [Prevotella sp.]|nr:hypothetical protein [Prevotella sp.]
MTRIASRPVDALLYVISPGGFFYPKAFARQARSLTHAAAQQRREKKEGRKYKEELLAKR